MTIAVLLAADGAAWESDLIAAFSSGRHDVIVTRRCVDVVELLALAAAGQGSVALISGSLRRLDADAVDRLLAAAVVPVGMVARADTQAEQRLRAMGIEYVVPDDAEPAVIAGVLTEAVERQADPGRSCSEARFGDPVRSMSVSIPPGPPDAEAVASRAGRRGTVVAVWGATGAPGRTTVAVQLSDELSRLGAATLLVDADVYGAAVGAVLGLLDESPGLAAACRHATAGRLDAELLAGLCWQLSNHLRVLTGIPLASRWPELRPAAVESVLAAARILAEFTVVDCGFNLETDEELSFDTLAPRRNAATLAVLESADVVIAVGAADPIGMQRLVRALADLQDLQPAAPVWVVLNRVRRTVVPGDVIAELTGAMRRFAGRDPVALLPYDLESLDAALVTGRSLAEARPNGPLRAELVKLAASVAGL
ncbi:MAG: chromosome partitioning protein [Jatrophihabitantaceae bacterium]